MTAPRLLPFVDSMTTGQGDGSGARRVPIDVRGQGEIACPSEIVCATINLGGRP